MKKHKLCWLHTLNNNNKKRGGGESRAKYFLEHNWAKLIDSKNTTTKLSGWWASQQWEAQRKLTETWRQKTMGIPLELWNHPNRHPTPHYVLFGGLCVPNAILLPQILFECFLTLRDPSTLTVGRKVLNLVSKHTFVRKRKRKKTFCLKFTAIPYGWLGTARSTCRTYTLSKNDHQNDKTLGWALWHLVFNVSTVVRNKVTKTEPESQLLRTTQQEKNPIPPESSPNPNPPPTSSDTQFCELGLNTTAVITAEGARWWVTHLIQTPCYQRGSPCQDQAGNLATRRPPDHRKETQTAVVWSCVPFNGSGQNHLARHSERGKKTRQTEEEVGRQHQEIDRPRVRQVPEGSGEQGKMEETGSEIICGAPATLAVKG